MVTIILKCVFLFLAIVYGFTCFARLVYGKSVSGAQAALMAIGIVGFCAVQWWI